MQGVNSPHNSSSMGAAAAAPSAAAPKRYARSFWWYLKMLVIGLQLIVFCLIVVTLSVGYGVYQRLSEIVPDVHFITRRTKASKTHIYSAPDARGKVTLLATLKGDRREWVSIETLKDSKKRNGKWVREPGRLMDATLAIEDSRFYTHPGMDAKRITKAAYVNLTSGNSTAQGGSTITEQLARNIYFKRNKSHSQRLQAALLALQLERRFTKDELLELYLNEISYGPQIEGCEAAAQIFFNKHARELDIAQAALLAGLPNSPSTLYPFRHPERAITRMRVVLREMLQGQRISYSQWKQARSNESVAGLRRTLIIQQRKFQQERRRKAEWDWKAPYFVSYVLKYLEKQGYSQEFLKNSGLKIYTTIDLSLQAHADNVMRERLDYLDGSGKLQGALVCIDPRTGHVLAMFGGRNYGDQRSGQFNRAVQARRQPGSTFKPYLYAAAVEQGYGPNSVEMDKPLFIGKKEIKNYDFAHHGPLSFREALGMSNNVVATRVLLKTGVQNVVQKAHLMGIESPLVPYASLALGASEISPLEHTSAFGVFATGGVRAEETPIDRIVNSTGEIIHEHPHPVRGARVLSEEAGVKMWDMLRYVVTNGTGRAAQIPNADVIGKTGTTSAAKDVWFIGATRQLATTVWMGYDKPQRLRGAAGGRWCAPAWRRFMIGALEVWKRRHPVEKMIEDGRVTAIQRQAALQRMKIVRQRVCNDNGKLANANCSSTKIVEFSAGGGYVMDHCDIPAHQVARGVRSLGEGVSDAPAVDKNEDNFDDAQTPGGSPVRRDGDIGDVPPSGADGSIDDGATFEGDGGLDTNGSGGNGGDAAISPDGSQAGGGETPVRRDSALRPGRSGASLARRNAPVRARRAAFRNIEESGDDGSNDALTLDDGGEAGGEVVAVVCADSGARATARCAVTTQQFFEPGQEPRRRCRLH